jgi:hypothetical protein
MFSYSDMVTVFKNCAGGGGGKKRASEVSFYTELRIGVTCQLTSA